MDKKEVRSTLTMQALNACEEANKLSKRIFKRVSNEDVINLSIRIFEVEGILNNKDEIKSFEYSSEGIKSALLPEKMQTALSAFLNDEPEYKKKIKTCIDIYPHMSISLNPVCLEDEFLELQKEINIYYTNKLKNEIFISSPIIRYDSIFFFILELDKDFLSRFVVLPPVRDNDESWLTSFTYQIINILLDYSRESFYLQLKFSTTSFEMSDDEIIRLATQDMTLGRSLPSPRIFSKISSQNYEGSSCKGKIAFVHDTKLIDNLIQFEESIELTEKNIRHIRKLLEMSIDSHFLFAKDDEIYGFGSISQDSNIEIIEFLGHSKWRMLFGNNEVLRSHNGDIILPKKNFDPPNCQNTLENFYSDVNCKKNFNYISSLIQAATKQEHGTMIIISTEAKEEVNRLCSNGRGTKIKPVILTNQNIINLSSIDGALMLDLNGTCYGVGVIVDGLSKSIGSPERGARYNSARDYTYEKNMDNKNVCVAIVISEDKSIDIIK